MFEGIRGVSYPVSILSFMFTLLRDMFLAQRDEVHYLGFKT